VPDRRRDHHVRALSLHVHRSDRADGLISALRDLLADAPADPFAREIVAVPTRGMERWLTQRLSSGLGASPARSDGICANVEFPFPRRLTGEAVAAASGIDPETDPWLPERLVWPLLDVVDGALEEPWLQPLAAHLKANRARRFAAVRHLADLFDRYALHRPELVRDWAAGEDQQWQAELWRRLHARIAEPDPAARLEGACARLREAPDTAELPDRVSLFGLTRLPAGQLQVLRALAHARDVHLFLLHPSPALWEKIATLAPTITRRAGDPTATLAANRLLASWGQDSRELQLVLGPDVQTHEHPVEHTGGTLLARLQADVRADRPPPGAPLPGAADERAPVAQGDRSIEVHACHGRARQVEVVRDAILHQLEEDPTLEPRDVIVMCPDIETFAPLIQATFGAGEVSAEDDELETLPAGIRPPDLRVRLADRSLRQTNPVLGVVARLLELAEQRLTASQVLDFADREPVRARFRLDDDNLARLEDWVATSGIRWGLDASHRSPFKLEDLPAGTWRSGLDRVLVGVTMTEEERGLFGGVLPLDDVESGAIDLAGRFAELVDRLQEAVDACNVPQTVDNWALTLARAADSLTTTAPLDGWQRSELQRLLDTVVREASEHPALLELSEVRALLAERLQGRPTRANFRTGHLTICTLVPMRSVPHRVVCLLGLDDGTFPRKAPRDGDDLMLADPHVGDRDSRTEDRQMLLDALLAASERLIVTYTGNDERTNIARPPAVPVGELLDMVERTAGPAARSRAIVRHPLQPFDPRNFTFGALVPAKPWSFDRVTLEGARALTGRREPRREFLLAPLPALEPGPVELQDLVKFVERPVRAFLRQRLGISVGDYADEIADALPVELDNLEKWGVGQRLLDAQLDGAEGRTAVLAEIARGSLPPGQLGKPVIDAIWPIVEEIAGQARLLSEDPAGSVDVKIDLDGRAFTGTVPGVRGSLLTTVTYSKVNPRHRLAAWVRLLALCASGGTFEAATIGRARSGSHHNARVTVARIAPLSREEAIDELRVLVDLFDRGLREPLPLSCLTSAAFAVGGDARGEWTSDRFDKEDKEPEHQFAFGGVLGFTELREAIARDDERWDPVEPTRFGQYALRLWAGLLAREAVTDQ
jgi:exodeoxyribonuclease V gamma subunit